MALINCSECGKQISDKASTCPNCGNPIIESAINQAVTQNDTFTNNENLSHCPKCNSTQLTSNKKGFKSNKMRSPLTYKSCKSNCSNSLSATLLIISFSI